MQKYGFRCSDISWLCSSSPFSSGLPFPLPQMLLAYTICILFPAFFALVFWQDTVSGFERSQHLDCSSFFRLYFRSFALISCKLGYKKLSTTYTPYSTSCCSPLYFPGSSCWLFWGSLIFRFLRGPVASLCPLQKNADTIQIFKLPVVSSYMNSGVWGDTLSPSFVVNVVYKFLVLLLSCSIFMGEFREIKKLCYCHCHLFFFCQNSLFSILSMMPTSEIKLTMDKPPSINFSKSRVSKI